MCFRFVAYLDILLQINAFYIFAQLAFWNTDVASYSVDENFADEQYHNFMALVEIRYFLQFAGEIIWSLFYNFLPVFINKFSLIHFLII